MKASARRWTHLFIVLNLLLLISMPSFAARKQVVIVTNNQSGQITRSIEKILQAEATPRPKVRLINHRQIVTKQDFEKFTSDSELIVTIGFRSAENIMRFRPQQDLMCMLIRKEAYDFLLEQNYNEQKIPQPKNITALFLDQPIYRTLNLARVITPANEKIGTIGVLLGPNSKNNRAQLETEAFKRGLQLSIAEVRENDNPVEAINYLLNDSSILLVTPDSNIYKRQTARGILITAFRNHKPVIAQTRAFVNVGALAAVYSEPKQFAKQAAAEIIAILKRNNTTQLPGPFYPNEFNVAINYQLALRFGYTLDSETTLRYQLEDMEFPE